MLNIIGLLSVDRYYRMDDQALEIEAGKFNIGGYGKSNGGIDRSIIIGELLKKDQANNSRVAIVISVLALLVSCLALLLKLV